MDIHFDGGIKEGWSSRYRKVQGGLELQCYFTSAVLRVWVTQHLLRKFYNFTMLQWIPPYHG
eukprot:1115232-Amorphochlora_amoeboformis.AAC.1